MGTPESEKNVSQDTLVQNATHMTQAEDLTCNVVTTNELSWIWDSVLALLPVSSPITHHLLLMAMIFFFEGLFFIHSNLLHVSRTS